MHLVPRGAFPASETVEIAKLAIETGAWTNYEIEKDRVAVTQVPRRRESVKDCVKGQGSFGHLDD